MSDWFKSKNSPPAGAKMPANVDEVFKRYSGTEEADT
jgi:hypothetical protein